MDNLNYKKLSQSLMSFAADDSLLKSYGYEVDNLRLSNIVDYVKIYYPFNLEKNSVLFALQCHNRDI